MSLYRSNPNPEYGFLIVADQGKLIVAKVEFQLSPNRQSPSKHAPLQNAQSCTAKIQTSILTP